MPDRRKNPRVCLGADEPCTALVWTRYAVRCKSCAAKVRLQGRDMTYQMATARRVQREKRRDRRAERIGFPVTASVPAGRLAARIRANGFTIAEASREVFGDSHTLGRQLAAGRIDDAAMFVLSEMFGEVVA